MNIMGMMKQAQQMQSKMQELEARMAETLSEGSAGGGAVKVVLTNKGEPRSISLDESVVVAAEKDLLEDLILAALKDAYTKGKTEAAAEMKKIMGGLNLPPGMSLPF